MKSTYSDMAQRRDYEYAELPRLAKAYADAAHAAHQAWRSAEAACALTTVTQGHLYEPTALLVLSVYRVWQELEASAQEALDYDIKARADTGALASLATGGTPHIEGDWRERMENWLREHGSMAPLSPAERAQAEERIRAGLPLEQNAETVLFFRRPAKTGTGNGEVH